MRILHVHKYYHAKDGVGRYLFDLMRLLEGAGHTTAALAMHDPRNLPSAWDEYFISELDTSEVRFGMGIFSQLRRSYWSPEAKEKMERMLDAFKPDVVHAHNLYTHLSPSVLEPCRARGIPVVMTVHDYAMMSANYSLWDGEGVIAPNAGILTVAKSRSVKGSFVATFVQDLLFRWQRRRKMYDRAIAQYITLSQFVKDAMLLAGYDEEKISIIPPCAGTILAGESYSHARDKTAYLFAGRLESYKGIELYLELAGKFPEETFYVAGTGPLEALVRQAASKSPNIVYLGFLEAKKLWEKMASVNAVIIPSLWYEAYGLVSLEAMSLGTPVLVSDRGGLPELVRASKGGKVFKAGNLKDLMKKFAELHDQKVWSEMSVNARTYTAEKNSPQVFLTRILKAYDSVRIYD